MSRQKGWAFTRRLLVWFLNFLQTTPIFNNRRVQVFGVGLGVFGIFGNKPNLRASTFVSEKKPCISSQIFSKKV
jgi:hypothetical protein